MQLIRLLVTLLGVVEIALMAAGSSPASSPRPIVTNALPGVKVELTTDAKRAGVRQVRRLLTSENGGRRVPLLVGVGPKRELCVGSTGFFTCHPTYDARPAYAVAVFGGAKANPSWGTVVGLVSNRVSRVVVQLQDGTEVTPRLRHWQGFPWAAFATQISGPNGRFPNSLTLIGSRGGRSESANLGWFYTSDACANSLRACPKRWTNAGDVFDPHPSSMTMRAKELAAAHALVGELLRGRDYTVEPISWGRPCDGRAFGSILTAWLFRPISVDRDFPFSDYREGKRRYVEGVLHIRASNVRAIDIAVDVLRGRVVGVDPMRGDAVHVSQVRFVEPFRPGPSDGC